MHIAECNLHVENQITLFLAVTYKYTVPCHASNASNEVKSQKGFTPLPNMKKRKQQKLWDDEKET